MVYEEIQKIKKEIEKLIANNSKYFYIEICRLLENAVKVIEKDFAYAGKETTLLPRLRIVMEAVNFNETSELEEIVKRRNRIAHELTYTPPFDKYVFAQHIEVYNDFISLLNQKYKYFPLIFRIDKSIFDIDMTVLNNTDSLKRHTVAVDMLEIDIKNREAKLKQLKGVQGKINKEIMHDQDVLLSSYKSILPKWIKEHSTLPPVKNTVIEFDYNIGLSKQDFGFYIKGIKPQPVCKNKYAEYFSVIHGFLTKNSIYHASRFVLETIDKSKYDYNIKYILRYQLIILALIKNNAFNDIINLNILDGTDEEFILAFEDIKNYLNILTQLRKEPAIKLEYLLSENGTTVSLKNEDGKIHCKEKNIKSENIYLWIEGRRLTYSISDSAEDENLLNELAESLFRIKKLKDGQAEAIKKMLNTKNGVLCLFPTGYGKSLIFYFSAFLSSGFSVVIDPTSALIYDQKRNLAKTHQIDNVMIVEGFADYSLISPSSKIIYLTAEMFINESFINRLAILASERLLNNLILDEVHSLSIWGHDFRPDYIMFSKYLKEYFSDIKIAGFTATAETRVLYDIKNILSIQDDNVVELKNKKRGDIVAEAVAVKTYEDIYQNVVKLIQEDFLSSRWLVFLKNKKCSDLLIKELPWEIKAQCDVCLEFKNDTYESFVNQNTNILITSHEMGVGINYPKVNNCVHIGYPISMNQFVQEVGRIAREDNLTGKAFIVAQSLDYFSDLETELLDINTPIEEIIESIRGFENGENDIVDLFVSIFDYLEGTGKAISRIMQIYNSLENTNGKKVTLYFCPVLTEKSKRMIQFYLILLTKIGLIERWFYSGDIKNNTCIYDVEKTTHWERLDVLKEESVKSISAMELSNTEKIIFDIKQSDTIKDLIIRFIQWYYEHYLDNQRTQLVNLVQAVDEQDLSAYFEINFKDLDKMREKLRALSVEDLLVQNEEYFDRKNIAMVVKLSEIEDFGKCDLFLLWGKAIKKNSDFANRLDRVTSVFGADFIKQRLAQFTQLYLTCSEENRNHFIKKLLTIASIEAVIMDFYSNFTEEELQNDAIYYNCISKLINEKLEGRL